MASTLPPFKLLAKGSNEHRANPGYCALRCVGRVRVFDDLSCQLPQALVLADQFAVRHFVPSFRCFHGWVNPHRLSRLFLPKTPPKRKSKPAIRKEVEVLRALDESGRGTLEGMSGSAWSLLADRRLDPLSFNPLLNGLFENRADIDSFDFGLFMRKISLS